MGHSALKVSQAIHDSVRRRSLTEDDVEALARENAAIRIQRAWRTKKRASYLGADILWTDLATHARFKVDRDAAKIGRNNARERWRRATFLTLRLQDGNQMLADDGIHDTKTAMKYLETQHWLEMIDTKHRYGANMKVCVYPLRDLPALVDALCFKYYHRRWQQEDTTDNFFKWLDQGGGKNLSLKECPRERLERERISYLSSYQRLNYFVQIDHEGKLRWAKTGELVDTTVGSWQDSGDGSGIVPIRRSPSQAAGLEHRTSFEVAPSRTTPGLSLDAEEPQTQLHYYLGPQPTSSRIKSWLWKTFTPRGLLERLLRRTLQKNTWIYVADKHFNIFIGIKTPGTFQHSSFLGGGLVTSAGLISVKEGVIHKLSPLSGHYRTSVQHFRDFLKILEQRGIDMHKVERSKAETALWAIEYFAKFKKKQAKAVKVSKQKVGNTLGTVRNSLSRTTSGGEASWKREIVEGRKKPVNNKNEKDLSRQETRETREGKMPAETTEFPADSSGAASQAGQNRLKGR